MVRIAVVGSVNVDIVVAVERLPTPGETVAGGTLLVNHGGKGANQAVAARRLGAEVRFLGCLGDDTFGTAARQGLVAEGIDTAGLTTIAGAATGVAAIVVDAAGRNQIAVASGANMLCSVDLLTPHAEALAWADMVLCQLEIPLPVVLWTLRTARQHGALTMLNPAPVQPLSAAIWPLVDYLTPNDIEAAHLSGLALTSSASAPQVAQALLARGPGHVVLTLGEHGACVCTPTQTERVPAWPVTAIDTTAAGDAFSGALAVALGEGLTIAEAVRFANATAALTCTRRGAWQALPERQQVEALLREEGDVHL